jgi:hypothetical protein
VVRPSRGVDSTLDRKTARQIAADVVAALAARRQLHRIVLWLEGGSDQAALVIAQVEVPGGKTTTVELSFSRAGYEIGRVRR